MGRLLRVQRPGQLFMQKRQHHLHHTAHTRPLRSKNKPIDAARLVDQSFYIQKSALGYAIQARAACLRHDVGGARAAIRNVSDPQLKQSVLRACVRQGVWLC